MADFSYRQIYTSIWKDSWFIDLTQEHKLLFIYLFSNERACLTGLYDLSLKVVAFETGLDIDTIQAGLDAFAQAGKVYYENGMIWVPSLLKHNAQNITSPKIQAHLRTLMRGTRDCPLKTRWIAYYNEMIDPRYRMDTVSIPDPEPESDHDHEHEQEQEQEQQESGATAPAADAAPPVVSPPRTFQEWNALLDTYNPPALVHRMIQILYPGISPPDYPEIGAFAKRMGRDKNGYRRLVGLLWEYASHPPQGDLLPYLLRVHQGKEKDNGSDRRKVSTKPVITALEP